jgi:palmitoyltransferase
MHIKETGFGRPLDGFQIFSWVLSLYQFLAFYLAVLVVITGIGQIVIGVFFTLAAIVVVSVGYLATASNPTDSVVIKFKLSQEKGYYIFSLTYLDRHSKYCNLCESWVSDSSKHCMTCNRCTPNFDHHCILVNNCIAEKNYKLFTILIASYQINQAILFSSSLYTILIYLSDNNSFEKRLLYKNATLGLTIICLSFASSFLTLCLNGYLISFHIFLWYKGTTTYDYICRNKNKRIRPNTEGNSSSNANDYVLVGVDSVLSDINKKAL